MHQADTLKDLLGELRRADYQFTTPSPATIERVNARSQNRGAIDLAGVFGWSRPFESGGLPERLRQLLAEADLLRADGDRFRSAIRVSSLGCDLFVHSAYPTTEADAVFFGPDTYRFVAALESHLASRLGQVARAVDIGCGAGPGGIALARRYPKAEVALVDINATALRYAQANARAAAVTNVEAIESDLLADLDGSFDLIVSNPPYLNDPLARTYRHGGGDLGEGLSLRIVDAALERLAPGGELILYTGIAIVSGRDPFREAVAARLVGRRVGWAYREIDPDVFGEELETDAYARADRIAAVLLTLNQGFDHA